ncbi:DUF1592 domain-containing protein [Urbifossiella limnaea]|uniref:Planctomycete cytochrome C n=1 Tax=Urbifossiella limnaea TaxID=2528023 RepID=A0A517Y032_9BACT|nr:DUF1592 domain-containing protein [Urbifossiella limnaea]QDU23103.1 Planctomycete cytochrome C [Urbifossiella limnaea]
MGRLLPLAAVVVALVLAVGSTPSAQPQPPAADFDAVRPLLKTYCLNCHSADKKKGSLDLERFATPADIRKEVKVWEQVAEQVEAGEMPPTGRPQPTADERKRLVAWVRGFLDAEARARAGDPGFVPLRRLSNAEFDYTIRDLTGVDLRPAREFPADGAAGEGFTNAAEALSDISPALFAKYLNAAKMMADHAVLLPDGFRFSPATTRRDWTDEATAALRRFYAGVAPPGGKLNPTPYLAASVKHRDKLLAGTTTVEAVAAAEKLNPKYLAALVRALSDRTPSQPLDAVRASWRAATEKDVPALAAEVAGWQATLWTTTRVGSYMRPVGAGFALNESRQLAVDPPAVESVPLRVKVAPAPGQSEVQITLAARSLAGAGGVMEWHRPRFEAPGKAPLLLRDYADFGPAFEADLRTAFADAAKYLAAVADPAAAAKGLDPTYLRSWTEVVAVPRPGKVGDAFPLPAAPLELLSEKAPPPAGHPTVSGWRKAGTDLPAVVANSGDKDALIPGRIASHGVGVHPLPQEFVAVAWTSPLAGAVKVEGTVAHAHPACGNGVAWRLEHRRGGRMAVLGAGPIDLGKSARLPAASPTVEKGDQLVLVVDARDGDHVCDMTGVSLTLAAGGRVWDLGRDVSANITAGNPHAGTWSFARGASGKGGPAPTVPVDSLLGRWRLAAADPARAAEATELAGKVQALLSGPRPADAKSPDRVLYDKLVVPEGPLFVGVDLARITAPRPAAPPFGLSRAAFKGDVLLSFGTTIRLPAALLAGREFVVDAKANGPLGDRVIQVQAGTAPPTSWTGPVLASPTGAGYAKLKAGNDAFRAVFPLYVAFPNVVPTDEVVSLRMFHREDEPLRRLFLSDEQAKQLDHLWTEHRFVSRQAVAENNYLPQFIGFVTQDQPKAMETFFVGLKPAFQAKNDAFLADEAAAAPKQLDALLAFAGRAYRRPLAENEKAGLLTLYRTVREKGAGHDEAFRGVLARVLVSPAFLFRVEAAPPGKAAGPVSDWELASRLSYFLWASQPDEQLRELAALGRLRDPAILAASAERMLQDDRVRALAIEFGTQWLHVRGFDELKEKNETLFPTFDAKLRGAIYEESIRFFDDFFRAGRPVTSILDADHTFVNDTLAKHYGIPGVTGPEFRRIDGVKKYGRGGILGFASVQARQSGASRTSPVLRGNWVVETLLGEKLPRPPANVPQLPETEGADKLTMRQQVERHAKDASCATCHVRIDPFGFALEKYDAIGRLREKDLGGLAVDTRATLRDGTAFDGIDGLRTYLLTRKRDVVVRLFCRRLLGYALGRAVTLSDSSLLDEMVAELNRNNGSVTAAVQTIVRSPQFRMVRGRDAE